MIEIVIPTYNDHVRLSLALWGYTKQTAKDFRIHIVNDGGDEIIEEIIKLFPQLDISYHYLEPKTEEYRPSRARNLAIANIVAPRFICTDTDIIPSPNLVEKHARFGGDNVIVLGRRMAITKNIVQEFEKKLLEKTLTYDDIRSNCYEDDYRILNLRPFVSCTSCSYDAIYDYSGAVPFDCWSFNLSLQTQTVREIGGFCESFDYYWGGEDTDLGIRLHRLGHITVAVDSAIGYHLDHPKRAMEIGWDRLHSKISEAWKRPIIRNNGPF